MSRRNPLSPEGRKGVDAYTARELHEFLVSDAVKNHATFLSWAVAAYERIGSAPGGKGADAAYAAVLAEVQQLTGRGLPVHSPMTPEELKRLMN
jgi:hypothetical protein